MAKIIDIVLTKSKKDLITYHGNTVLFKIKDRNETEKYEAMGSYFFKSVKNDEGCKSLIKDLPDKIDVYRFERKVARPLTTDETDDRFVDCGTNVIKLGDELIELETKFGKIIGVEGISRFYLDDGQYTLDRTDKQIEKTKLITRISSTFAKKVKLNIELSAKNLNLGKIAKYILYMELG